MKRREKKPETERGDEEESDRAAFADPETPLQKNNRILENLGIP